MPLLDIIGVSCFNTSFYFGFVFLEKEDEENYTWAINAFKNILGQETLFEKNWGEFAMLYNENRDAVEYVKKNWLLWKEKFVSDFKKVKEDICLAVKHEFNEMKVKLAYERLQVPHNCNMPLFRELLSQQTTLPLDLVHLQWRIGALSLNPKDDLPNDDANKFSKLLNELCVKYQEWPLSKKEFATSMITKLVNQNDILFEPVIQRPKG
ncbi:hypothetical protein Tco_1301369 [Tanacetum coccineum]